MTGLWRGLLCVCLGASLLEASPNVVVILTDDQGYGDLSCHGNPHLKTPELDALKERSTSFERFFVSPTCSPTRAALLTGKHEFEVSVSHTILGRSLLKPDVPTLPEVLRDAGYATGIFGKWHLGDAYPCRPEDRGFDEVFIHGNGGIGQVGDAWGNAYVSPKIRRKSGWEETEGYCTDVFFEEAKRWVGKQVDADEPFFMWLATNAPHSPYHAPEGAKQRFLDEGLKEPVASFYAMIENIDQNVGGLLRELERLEIEEDTIVVFLTDNGSAVPFFDAGMKGAKGSPHEGGIRVPCFWSWKGKIAAGKELSRGAWHADLMPTLLSLCEVDAPEEWNSSGVDLSDALTGDGALPEGRTFYAHVGRWPGNESPERNRTRNFSVRNDAWRLVGLALYDMEKDPGQKSNVFEEHQEDAAAMLAEYGRWWNEVLPGLQEPVRYRIGHPASPVVSLNSHDWWPSIESVSSEMVCMWNQQQIVGYLDKARVAKTRNTLPECSGHWKLHAHREGNYRITMSLLPKDVSDEERKRLGRLRSGKAHVRVAKNEVQLEVLDDATAVTVHMDLDEGPLNLEAWFSGQLPDQRRVGAFFVDIERVGDRKVVLPEIQVMPVEEAEQLQREQQESLVNPEEDEKSEESGK